MLAGCAAFSGASTVGNRLWISTAAERCPARAHSAGRRDGSVSPMRLPGDLPARGSLPGPHLIDESVLAYVHVLTLAVLHAGGAKKPPDSCVTVGHYGQEHHRLVHGSSCRPVDLWWGSNAGEGVASGSLSECSDTRNFGVADTIYGGVRTCQQSRSTALAKEKPSGTGCQRG